MFQRLIIFPIRQSSQKITIIPVQVLIKKKYLLIAFNSSLNERYILPYNLSNQLNHLNMINLKRITDSLLHY